MDFNYALNALREDQKVARQGWNDKNMFIYMVRDGNDPYIAMKAADENVVPWPISQADLLAEDWAIV